MALVAEVVAPGEHAQCVAMQDVLAGEADRAVHLVGDRSALLRGFDRADFRGGGFEEDRVVGLGGLGLFEGTGARRRGVLSRDG